MKRTWRRLMCVWAATLVFTLCLPISSWAQKGGKGPQGGKGHVKSEGRGRGQGKEVRNGWDDRDRSRVVVTEYYGRRGLPPGLAKKRALPPGLRRQLRVRGHLPPGIESYWVVVPAELEYRLPPLPPYYVRRVVGEDLIVVDVRTNFVVSIMAGVFIRW